MFSRTFRALGEPFPAFNGRRCHLTAPSVSGCLTADGWRLVGPEKLFRMLAALKKSDEFTGNGS